MQQKSETSQHSKRMVANQVNKIVKETDSRPLTTNILKPKIHGDRDILNKNKKENTLREEQIKNEIIYVNNDVDIRNEQEYKTMPYRKNIWRNTK